MAQGKNWESLVTVYKDPKVFVLSPERSTGRRPTFDFKIRVGQSEQPVALSQMKCQLDGQDFTRNLTVTSKMNQSSLGQVCDREFDDEDRHNNPLFEIIQIKGRPTLPLSLGPHSVTLTVSTVNYPGTGPGQSIVTVNFRVEREDER